MSFFSVLCIIISLNFIYAPVVISHSCLVTAIVRFKILQTLAAPKSDNAVFYPSLFFFLNVTLC